MTLVLTKPSTHVISLLKFSAYRAPMTYIRTILVMVLMLGFTTPFAAAADKDPVYTSWRNNNAAGGYDVVSFFSGKPQEGKSAFSVEYKGAIWKFNSRANLDLFNTNPEAFAPQYGGYCAWAVANGKLAKGSPDHWDVVDGRLYLNFNRRIREQWRRDETGFIEKANVNWPEILSD